MLIIFISFFDRLLLILLIVSKMTNTIASITYEDDITIITLDDGKANAFSYDMLTQVHRLLDQVPQKSGALIIKGRNGIFYLRATQEIASASNGGLCPPPWE